MREILKKKMKTYKYKIIFKNNNKSEGIITAKNLSEVHGILCTNKFQEVPDGRKAFYWNANEINTIEVELLEKGKE